MPTGRSMPAHYAARGLDSRGRNSASHVPARSTPHGPEYRPMPPGVSLTVGGMGLYSDPWLEFGVFVAGWLLPFRSQWVAWVCTQTRGWSLAFLRLAGCFRFDHSGWHGSVLRPMAGVRRSCGWLVASVSLTVGGMGLYSDPWPPVDSSYAGQPSIARSVSSRSTYQRALDHGWVTWVCTHTRGRPWTRATLGSHP